MSNETFRAGEIAITKNIVLSPELNGLEVEIKQGPQDLLYTYGVSGQMCRGFGYYVLAQGRQEFWFLMPHQLRKRRPPQDWKKLCKLTDLPREVTHV